MKKMKFLLTAIAAVGVYTLGLAQSWNLTGNSSTTPGTNYIGTTDAQDLIFKTTGVEAMRIAANGNLRCKNGIGVEGAPTFSNPGGTFPSSIFSIIANTDPLLKSSFGVTSRGGWIYSSGVLNLRTKTEIGDPLLSPSHNPPADFYTGTYRLFVYGGIMTDQLKIGNVTTPAGYKLYVADGIYTHKFETSSTSAFGDVVTIGTITPTTGHKLYVADGIYTDKITIGSTTTPAGFKLYVADGLYTNKIRATGLSEFADLVTIGNVTTNANYKLFVEKGILTEKVKVAVKTTANWSDYVFAKDYKLMSLGEVESYINKNKHLPGVPSAEEVVNEGIDMATMDAKLLEKIEELTLYMIELKKENEAMKTEISKIKQSVK